MRKSRLEHQADIGVAKCRNKELVMHMSNLPVFLQRAKENSVQEKALNFGVLDWNRLEKWKNSDFFPENAIEEGSFCGKSISSVNREAKVDLSIGSCRSSQGWSSSSLPSGSHFSSVQRQSHLSNESGTSHECQMDEAPENKLFDFCAPRSPYDSDTPDSFQDSCHKEQGNMLYSNFYEEEKSPSLKPEVTGFMMPGKTPKLSCIDEFVMQSEFSGKFCSKGRAHTLFRKVRCSLARITKSSSFRDCSSLQGSSSPCSSVIHGRSKPEAPSIEDSRLWRFLDPLFKRSTVQSADMCPGAMPSQKRQAAVSKVQALLQLTLKNELPPLYKLVLESSNSMVVAAATKSPVAGKHGQSMTYTFYSVCDIKKKSMNWIAKGSSGKPCGLAYNVIGQMEISTTCDPGECRSGSKWTDTREWILYGADPETNHSADPILHKEIAAIITNTSKKPHHAEGGACNGTVVILPAAVHSTPVKGAPSSLVSRWRSGGSCDCGGWDVGCKLRVLNELHESSKNLQESASTSNVGNLKLFPQGEDHTTSPVLSMEPLKAGLYSIIFDDSIPMLEAFAICVAQLTCQTHRFLGLDVENDTKELLQVRQCGVKYSASRPPLSPADRI